VAERVIECRAKREVTERGKREGVINCLIELLAKSEVEEGGGEVRDRLVEVVSEG
jgi:hypothetical protein